MQNSNSVNTLQEIVAVESPTRHSAQSSIQSTATDFRNVGSYFGDEVSLPQGNSWSELIHVFETISPAIQLTVSKALTNLKAAAPLVLRNDEQEVVLEIDNVPTTVLVQLRAWLQNLVGVIDRMPTLPIGENWTFDEELSLFVKRDDEGNVVSTSTAVPPSVRSQLSERLKNLLAVLQTALVRANQAPIEHSDILDRLGEYLFAPIRGY